MTVVIAKSFQKDFLKIFHEHDFKEFTEKIVKTELLCLQIPFKKFRFNIKNIAIRGICFVTSKGSIVPIFIVKKTDKLYGMNLIINSNTLKIFENKYRGVIENMESGNYLIF